LDEIGIHLWLHDLGATGTAQWHFARCNALDPPAADSVALRYPQWLLTIHGENRHSPARFSDDPRQPPVGEIWIGLVGGRTLGWTPRAAEQRPGKYRRQQLINLRVLLTPRSRRGIGSSRCFGDCRIFRSSWLEFDEDDRAERQASDQQKQ
jgi:hypothetical protein